MQMPSQSLYKLFLSRLQSQSLYLRCAKSYCHPRAHEWLITMKTSCHRLPRRAASQRDPMKVLPRMTSSPRSKLSWGRKLSLRPDKKPQVRSAHTELLKSSMQWDKRDRVGGQSIEWGCCYFHLAKWMSVYGIFPLLLIIPTLLLAKTSYVALGKLTSLKSTVLFCKVQISSKNTSISQ